MSNSNEKLCYLISTTYPCVGHMDDTYQSNEVFESFRSAKSYYNAQFDRIKHFIKEDYNGKFIGSGGGISHTGRTATMHFAFTIGKSKKRHVITVERRYVTVNLINHKK